MKHLIVSQEPNSDGKIRLEKKDYNYLVSVRRVKKAQKLSLLLKGSKLVLAEVVEINTKKKYLDLKLLDEQEEFSSDTCKNSSPAQRVEIVLMQWLIKGQHMDLAVRQVTEAGVSAIFSVLGEFSTVKKESSGQFERKQRIIREARQQSGSLIDTKLFSAETLSNALDNVKNYAKDKKTAYLMLTEKKIEKSFLSVLKEKPELVVLAIGCEGGISQNEEKILTANEFKPVHFDTNVLRAETAAIYSVAAVQAIMQTM